MISKSALKSGGATVLSGLVTYILVRGVIEICELSFTLGKTVYKNRKSTSFPKKAPVYSEEVIKNVRKLDTEVAKHNAQAAKLDADANLIRLAQEKENSNLLNENFAKSFLVKINSKATGLGASAASIAKKIHF
jgi:hypothetical protein